MIHPIVDDIEYYQQIKSLYGCVALKLHGIAGGYSPEMIDASHIEAIRSTGLPLIIHTDFDKRNDNDLARIRNMNTPRGWLNFLQDNDLKGYLCHGCRMDISVLTEIAKLDNIMVGIGPDWAIQHDVYRLHDFSEKDYLTTLVSILPKEKIAFDIDYCYMDGDDNFMNRMNNVLPKDYYDSVMGRNATHFFDLSLPRM